MMSPNSSGGRETSLGVDGKLERRVGICNRSLVELASRDLLVLLAEGFHDLRGRHVVARELVGVEPNAHTVFARPEHLQVADVGDTRKAVVHLADGVVGEVELVAALVGRNDVNANEHVGRTLFHDNPDVANLFGQSRSRHRHAVLNLHLRDVEIRADFESHRDYNRAVFRSSSKIVG